MIFRRIGVTGLKSCIQIEQFSLDFTWMSKYNDDIKFDNKINLISRIKVLADIIIVSELEKLY